MSRQASSSRGPSSVGRAIETFILLRSFDYSSRVADPDMAGELEASVVIPTHNRAPLLDRVLASFVTQNADPSVFEVIVVDDGSTDDTSAVCRKYEQRLDLRYVPIARAGLPAAKNAGLTVARGPDRPVRRRRRHGRSGARGGAPSRASRGTEPNKLFSATGRGIHPCGSPT